MPYQPRASFENPYGPQIAFRTEDVLPPSAYYVAPDDSIVCGALTDVAGVSINMLIRLLTPQGEVKLMPYTFSQPTLNAYGPVFEVPPVEGYLLGVLIWAVEPDRGRCYVTVSVVRGIPPNLMSAGLVLLQGYVNTSCVLSYPTSPLEPALSGKGALISLSANPGLGQEFTFACPSFVRWRIISAFARLQTDAVVASREVHYVVSTNTGLTLGAFASGLKQSANTLLGYAFAPGGGVVASDYTSVITGPAQLELSQGFQFSSFTPLMDAGDQYTSVGVLVEEWLGH